MKTNYSKLKLKFYLPSECPKCHKKTFDSDEGKCSSCGYDEFDTGHDWGG